MINNNLVPNPKQLRILHHLYVEQDQQWHWEQIEEITYGRFLLPKFDSKTDHERKRKLNI